MAREVISFRLSNEELEILDKIAEKENVPRSVLLHVAISRLLEDYARNNLIPELKEYFKAKRAEEEQRKAREQIKLKLWAWNAVKMLQRLQNEGVPEPTVKSIYHILLNQMLAVDEKVANEFRELWLSGRRRKR